MSEMIETMKDLLIWFGFIEKKYEWTILEPKPKRKESGT